MENLVTIPPLVLKNSLQAHSIYELLSQKIIDEIKKIPNVSQLKLNTELTALVSTLVENTTEKDQKIDKKKLVIQILQTVFNLLPPEIVIIGQQIEFLLDNKLVKKVTRKLSNKVYNGVKNVLHGKLSTKNKSKK
jgi:hypothetical protein